MGKEFGEPIMEVKVMMKLMELKLTNKMICHYRCITSSPTNMSTVGSYKENSTGGKSCFLAKFNSLGIRTWGTYFGGEFWRGNSH